MSDNRGGGNYKPRGDRGRGGGRGQHQNRGRGRSGGARYGGEAQSTAGPSGYRGRDQRQGGDSRGQGRPGQSQGWPQHRGQDRGQADVPPLKFDVIKTAVEVKIKREAKGKQRGTKGVEVELITNHYPIQVKAVPCFQYDLSINIRKRVDNQLMTFKGPFNEKVRVINKMVEDWPEVFRFQDDIICFASDGAKNLFTKTKLDIEEKESRDMTMTLDGYPEQTFIIEIQFVAEVDLNVVNSFYERKDVEYSLTHIRDIQLQVYDIVTTYNQKLTHVSVGRSLFPTNTRSPNNPMIGFGHFQSVVMTESGLTLNVDRAATIFRTGTKVEPLTDFIARELRVSPSTDPSVVRELNRGLKDLKIFTNHIKIGGMPQKRGQKIDGVVRESADSSIITLESGERKSITKFFAETHGVVLRHPKWPLIQMKGGKPNNRKYLPIEVCFVYENQPMPKSLITPEQQDQLTSSTNQMTPPERFSCIQEARNKIVDQDVGNLISQFGLNIGQNPIKVKGRKLAEPKVKGSQWELDTPAPRGLNNYLFFNLSKNALKYLKNDFNNFFYAAENNLVDTAKKMRLIIKKEPMDNFDLISYNELNDPFDAYERNIKAAKKKFGNKIEMIFVVLPNDRDLHDYVKLLAEVDHGIPTQCINENRFMRTKRGYFNNFTLKINAKLNGRNLVLAPGQMLPVFSQNLNTMIIGADVCHPGYHNPLAKERVISSIAAVVGSYDKDFSKYVANVWAQPAGTEFITNFNQMLIKVLRFFKEKNKSFPQNIVFFRDGVSESQLDAVLNGEIPLINSAYDTLKAGFHPKITAFVVQKRHHTRLLPTNPGNNKGGNIASGTVLDHTITSPHYQEFYLASHNSPLGTSRPAKYVVLQNDHNLSADDWQKLAYYMCFAFCRCPTPISIPIPTKYADLAAYRTKQYANQMERILSTTGKPRVVFEDKPKKETEEQKRERETRNIDAMNNGIQICDNLSFTPFYC